MDLYQTRAELKNRAKRILGQNMGSAILVHLLPFLILVAVFMVLIFGGSFLLAAYLLSFGTDFAGMEYEAMYRMLYGLAYRVVYSPQVLIPSFLIIVLVEILYNIFSAGYALFYLNAVCGRPCSCADAFRGYKRYFGKGFLIAGIIVILSTLCTLPYNLCYYLTPWRVSSLWNSVVMLLFVAGEVLSLFVTVSFSQSWYLMLDFPQYSAVKILSLSVKKMRGHKMRYFLLMVSFLPWMLLAAGTMFLGLLWLLPYMNMTYALFYLDLMKPQQQGGIV